MFTTAVTAPLWNIFFTSGTELLFHVVVSNVRKSYGPQVVQDRADREDVHLNHVLHALQAAGVSALQPVFGDLGHHLIDQQKNKNKKNKTAREKNNQQGCTYRYEKCLMGVSSRPKVSDSCGLAKRRKGHDAQRDNKRAGIRSIHTIGVSANESGSWNTTGVRKSIQDGVSDWLVRQ